jgi:GTP cyclohydrolase I
VSDRDSPEASHDRVAALTGVQPAGVFDGEKIRAAVRMLLEAIGEDPDRDGLRDTPARIAREYDEIFAGLLVDPRDVLTVTFTEDYDELVLVRDIEFHSMCEHHLLPFHGVAHVGYLPNSRGQITGLSKLARVVDVVAKRPGLQERMTRDIADVVEDVLDPRGVIVVVDAEHLCMAMRGIRKPGSRTVTSAVRGLLREDPRTRAEAMALLRP